MNSRDAKWQGDANEILELRGEIAQLKDRMAVLIADNALLHESLDSLQPRIVAMIAKVNEFVGRFSVAQ